MQAPVALGFDNTRPIALIRAFRTVAITAIGVGDTGLFTFTATLPPNFVYQLVEARVNVLGPAEADIAAWNAFMRYSIIENQVVLKTGLLVNIANQAFSSVAVDAVELISIANTNDFGTSFLPWPSDPLGGDIYDGSDNTVIFTVTWVGPNASIAALNWAGYFRFLQYRVEQINYSPLWTPQYTV